MSPQRGENKGVAASRLTAPRETLKGATAWPSPDTAPGASTSPVQARRAGHGQPHHRQRHQRQAAGQESLKNRQSDQIDVLSRTNRRVIEDQ